MQNKDMCYVENKKDVNESFITNSKFPDLFKMNECLKKWLEPYSEKTYTVTNYTDLQYYNKIKYVKSYQLT